MGASPIKRAYLSKVMHYLYLDSIVFSVFWWIHYYRMRHTLYTAAAEKKAVIFHKSLSIAIGRYYIQIDFECIKGLHLISFCNQTQRRLFHALLLSVENETNWVCNYKKVFKSAHDKHYCQPLKTTWRSAALLHFIYRESKYIETEMLRCIPVLMSIWNMSNLKTTETTL